MADIPMRGIQPFGKSVGFMLSQLGLVVSRQFGDVIGAVELEPRQFAVMRAIDAAAGQPQNAIAERMQIPTSSMVSIVDQLEARGLVERRPHESDRRTRTLHLTVLGGEVLARAMVLALDYERRMCDGLDAAVRESLLESLAHIAANLDTPPGVHPDVEAGAGKPLWSDEMEPLGEP
ncbi:MAG: mexR [Acidimicrobiaceae bacterium]|jgi:DNA-binding MarR family transcriptional regulator|nr:mexR [Acidimicrobiaceae bacterium]